MQSTAILKPTSAVILISLNSLEPQFWKTIYLNECKIYGKIQLKIRDFLKIETTIEPSCHETSFSRTYSQIIISDHVRSTFTLLVQIR